MRSYRFTEKERLTVVRYEHMATDISHIAPDKSVPSHSTLLQALSPLCLSNLLACSMNVMFLTGQMKERGRDDALMNK